MGFPLRVGTLDRKIIEQITKPTDRGKQRKVGPSQLGGCALCLAESLAVSLPDVYNVQVGRKDFGLASWIGTGVHSYLEETLHIPGAIKEQKNFIYHLEGYGDIAGSTDLFVEGHVKDYKVVGKWSYDEMCLDWQITPNVIPKVEYRAQQQLYGYGWQQAGHDVKTVGLVVIPKMSNRADDIKFFTEPYSQAYAKGVLERLEKIWAKVREGKLSEIPSTGNCYYCSRIAMRA